MKKAIMIVAAGLFAIAGLKAQTIQEGVNHLNADRFQTAISVFERLLAANPNNIEASYWLGQTYLDMDDNDKARQVYDKALTTTANAPLIVVGRGHVDLLEKKTAEAKQRFESALTASRGKKGDDPAILLAIGRANVDAKDGDLPYAIEKLEAAAQKDPNNPAVFLQLGNAYRKARPGEGGGQAFTNYNKALTVDPNYVVAYIRLAKLFEAQKNWELVLQNLNASVAKDPKFTTGYYELFYYYFFRAKLPEAEGYLKQYLDSKAPEKDQNDEFLYGQLCWAKKDYACAIAKGEGVVAVNGEHTKPKVFKLLADSYNLKGDSVNARKYIDRYFAREKPDQMVGYDYTLKADIYSKFPAESDALYAIYLKGVEVDTVLDNKIDILKKGAAYFKAQGLRDKEGDFMVKLIEMKPKPIINDYFDATRAYYFAKMYDKSRDMALKMEEKYPTEVYGYEWAYNNSTLVDSVKKDSIAVPDALKLYDFSGKDTTKFKKQYISSTRFLAGYYNNDAKDKEKALEFLKKWQEADTANAATIQSFIDNLNKTPAKSGNPPRGGSQPKAGSKTPNPKPASPTRGK
jgi:Flp pilus assembly protein TadD